MFWSIEIHENIIISNQPYFWFNIDLNSLSDKFNNFAPLLKVPTNLVFDE